MRAGAGCLGAARSGIGAGTILGAGAGAGAGAGTGASTGAGGETKAWAGAGPDVEADAWVEAGSKSVEGESEPWERRSDELAFAKILARSWRPGADREPRTGVSAAYRWGLLVSGEAGSLGGASSGSTWGLPRVLLGGDAKWEEKQWLAEVRPAWLTALVRECGSWSGDTVEETGVGLAESSGTTPDSSMPSWAGPWEKALLRPGTPGGVPRGDAGAAEDSGTEANGVRVLERPNAEASSGSAKCREGSPFFTTPLQTLTLVLQRKSRAGQRKRSASAGGQEQISSTHKAQRGHPPAAALTDYWGRDI